MPSRWAAPRGRVGWARRRPRPRRAGDGSRGRTPQSGPHHVFAFRRAYSSSRSLLRWTWSTGRRARRTPDLSRWLDRIAGCRIPDWSFPPIDVLSKIEDGSLRWEKTPGHPGEGTPSRWVSHLAQHG